MRQIGGLTFPAAEWAGTTLDGQNNAVLRVVGRYDPPFLSWVRRENSTEHFGFLMDVWQLIADELQLRYQFTDAEPKEFGNLLPNGTWTGIVGQLASAKADVGLSWLSYSHQRAKEVEFVDAIPVAIDSYNFFVVEGSSDRIRFHRDMFAQLTRPLHTDVWLVLLASLLVVSLVLRLTIRFCRPAAESTQTQHEFDLATCHLYTFMSVMSQGWANTPDSLPARIVTISGWMLGLLINVNYTANLISYLAVTPVNKPISGLQEFLSENDWRLAAEGGLNAFQDWQTSADGDYQDLYQLINSDRHILLEGSADSSRQCLQPKVLCFQDPSRLFYFLTRNACVLHPLLNDDPPKSRNYLVLRKGLGALRKAANKVLQKLNQNGALQRLRAQWFPSSASACSSSVVFTPLSLPELFAVVVVIPLACVVSALMLGGELVVGRVTGGRHSGHRSQMVLSSAGSGLRSTEAGLKLAELGRRRWSIQEIGSSEVTSRMARTELGSAGLVGSTDRG